MKKILVTLALVATSIVFGQQENENPYIKASEIKQGTENIQKLLKNREKNTKITINSKEYLALSMVKAYCQGYLDGAGKTSSETMTACSELLKYLNALNEAGKSIVVK